MKKFAAIFFLIVFAFNWFGYRLVYNFLQQKTNENLEALFDKNSYDEDQLIELKIAVNVPYQTSRNAYERYDGEIKVDGAIYKYVKRKIVNDTLYVLCYPNSQKMHLETAKNNFFKLTNDLEQNDNGNNNGHFKSVAKNLQPVFNESSFAFKINAPLTITKTLHLVPQITKLPAGQQFIPAEPPELAI